MPSSPQDLLRQTLLLDIEVNENNIIYAIGAIFGDKTFQAPAGRKIDRSTLAELDAFAREARFVLRHNILNHDLPRLRRLAPDLRLLARPSIDTLFLSPLAYPANPYHRLIKNYQIVRDSINDPVQDAQLAGRVFAEQWDALVGQFAVNSDVPLLYRGFLAADAELAGTAEALAGMGIPLLQGNDLHDAFAWFARRHACLAAVDTLVTQLVDGLLPLPPLAYVTAWLSVAGGNSVLPPWVRHQFPLVASILHQLRENCCHRPDCDYCRNHHDPRSYLRNFYGFPDFRAEPATADGHSLQEEIVTAAARGHSLFATLPTGGGKSLCYLLPALMRYHRRNTLTIVISPLQALMKDQVDNFSRLTGTRIAAALSGMLTMPERTEVLEGVRLGDIGILLVSPEQLRNTSFRATISQREIGAWVFDEAHCLSKWGHDFRPDYLYAIRFIREFAEREHVGIPPVQCFTATAKKDVKAEIIDIILRELGLKMRQFAGGHERINLHYEVQEVSRYDKDQVILDLLRSRYDGRGSVVIYCARRKNTEKLAELLQARGYTAEAFHAGLEPALKKRIQDGFIAGITPIICATNAFGMGIDKEDVRLVIHVDIPASLENYLQEAGRAGRDRHAAECVLIFDEQDIEGQFRLSCRSMLDQREIGRFLRGIRQFARGENTVVLTLLKTIFPQDTFWRDNLNRLLQDWQEETGDTPQPAAAVEEYLHEALAEQDRMKTIADGLFLATAHAVKGLEFDHVFILGDSWDKEVGAAIADERRLFYVSMSRARETLHLFVLDTAGNPHARLLAGDFTGERVVIQGRNNHLELMDSDGVAIARLSKKAYDEWADRLDSIREARIVALVRRYRDDVEDKKFQTACHGRSWEVPIVEVMC
ncbi:RecQ family ATP-dependent DNA helicase [Desulfoprunum benzoelyticum]|uniref:DNA 3'-5' helicase n=1 Tax=Desulfoprunum benzoelyticum TaxID=1506996 RepID=A0A840UZM2_9BACT|nr:RecQ family ATP-dependent DNA helicase [Desulfoprunum benzoelyticum]MBB5348098.1 RecQ family ATP-dependent DNA helicase [Desulfoprunum benzoelyticum]MBM9530291.1 RecQ family ATP-dependent DNA helicase [Desulfoprunum benzoelyticum]